MRRLAVLSFASGQTLHVETLELSESGLSVISPKPLANGIECGLRFDVFFNGRRVVVVGSAKVVNCTCVGLEGFRLGMQMTVADAQVQHTLAEFLSTT
jgi:hypothetical protein